MKSSRRTFLTQSAGVSAGFLGLNRYLSAADASGKEGFSYGELIPDPKEILDLPKGFSYKVISTFEDPMDDGYKVPGQPDGMAAFAIDNDRLVLIRNHEIGHSYFQKGPFENNTRLPEGFDASMSYDPGRFNAQPFLGGTSNIVYNTKTGKVEKEFLSLTGTDRNCAGGPTPWNSWITCEEPADMTSKWGQVHGYCFDVPASAEPGLAKPEPIKAMGRFRHEAIAVDPDTDIIYQTEDRNDGVIYRMLPKERKNPLAGGTLQALKIKSDKALDTRNWPGGKGGPFPIGQRIATEWVDLDDVESPDDTLRFQAIEKGAAIFSRGEGMWYGSVEQVGDSSIYWACTDGGKNRSGQIFRYFPGENGADGEVELYLEPNNTDLLKNGDNITISPSGHLYICEDTAGAHMRGVSKEGDFFTFGRYAGKSKSEFAGACFSPDGSTMFVNLQSNGLTLVVTGPFV